MSFELKTELQTVGDTEALVFLMRVNSDKDEDWFNCGLEQTSFANKHEAWEMLHPTIKTLLNGCYNDKSPYQK